MWFLGNVTQNTLFDADKKIKIMITGKSISHNGRKREREEQLRREQRVKLWSSAIRSDLEVGPDFNVIAEVLSSPAWWSWPFASFLFVIVFHYFSLFYVYFSCFSTFEWWFQLNYIPLWSSLVRVSLFLCVWLWDCLCLNVCGIVYV